MAHRRIAHRGFAAVAEENSLAAIKGALDRGADMVEIDVRRRADGALVLHHDSGDAPAAPLLSDALELITHATNSVMVDLKEGRTADDVADLLIRYALGITIVVSGNPDEARKVKARIPAVLAGRTWPDKNAQGIPIAEGIVGWIHRQLLLRRMDQLLEGFDLLVAFHRVLARDSVERCHSIGRQVYAWTVDGPDRVEQLRAIGVDGVISDEPASLGL